MRAGALGGHPVAAVGLEIGRGSEPRDRRPGRGDRGVLVGATRAHVDQCPPLGGAPMPAAAEATAVSWLKIDSASVSKITHSANCRAPKGQGSQGTSSPSAYPSMSPLNLKSRR